MFYAVAIVLSLLVGLNLYASWKVLRDDLNTITQTLLQLGVIWFLPIIGAVLTTSLGGTRHPTIDVPSSSGMEGVNYWHSSLGSGDAPTDQSCASDYSCD